jgi:hypothetical protein
VIPILLDQRFALDPCRTCHSSLSLCSARDARFFKKGSTPLARAPGSPPTGKTGSRLGTLSCLQQSLVPLDQRFAIDPYRTLICLGLENLQRDAIRIPDSPPTGETFQTAEERLCFTPPIFSVKPKAQSTSSLFSSICMLSTAPCHDNWAGAFGKCREKALSMRFFVIPHCEKYVPSFCS